MRFLIGALLSSLLPGILLAHDTWLIPTKFRVEPGQPVQLRLATSEAFPTSEVAAAPERIARFTLHTASGVQRVEGYKVDGTFLVAEVTPPQPGHAVIVAETKPRAFVLEPKIFNQYLQEERLKTIVGARARANQTDSPGRERYRKITKTILCVGEASDSLYAQPEGLWLEIVPERSPCGLRAGDSLTVRVLFEGRPLAGVYVGAGYEGVTGHRYPVWLETDSEGRAAVRFDRPGVWFVRTLHMVPASQDAEADWQSAFSTLTFAVGAATSSIDSRGNLSFLGLLLLPLVNSEKFAEDKIVVALIAGLAAVRPQENRGQKIGFHKAAPRRAAHIKTLAERAAAYDMETRGEHGTRAASYRVSNCASIARSRGTSQSVPC